MKLLGRTCERLEPDMSIEVRGLRSHATQNLLHGMQFSFNDLRLKVKKLKKVKTLEPFKSSIR
jgi:hypothetical protein